MYPTLKLQSLPFTPIDSQSIWLVLNEEKVGDTATPVVCGWAGAVMKRLLGHLGRSGELKKLLISKKK